MNAEADLVFTLWEGLRELIPSTKRDDAALLLVRAFEDYGFEAKDIMDAADEDDILTAACESVFENSRDEDDYNNEYED